MWIIGECIDPKPWRRTFTAGNTNVIFFNNKKNKLNKVILLTNKKWTAAKTQTPACPQYGRYLLNRKKIQ